MYRTLLARCEYRVCSHWVYIIVCHFHDTHTLQEKKKKGRWWKVLISASFGLVGVSAMAAYLFLSARMGNINIERLQQTLREMDKKGLWKHSGEGIKVLNKGLLN